MIIDDRLTLAVILMIINREVYLERNLLILRIVDLTKCFLIWTEAETKSRREEIPTSTSLVLDITLIQPIISGKIES